MIMALYNQVWFRQFAHAFRTMRKFRGVDSNGSFDYLVDSQITKLLRLENACNMDNGPYDGHASRGSVSGRGGFICQPGKP